MSIGVEDKCPTNRPYLAGGAPYAVCKGAGLAAVDH
jgi:hypothetical protein